MSIAPSTSSAASHLLSRAKSDQISAYFRQLHALLHAGVGLSFALSALGERKKSTALQHASAEMSRAVGDGKSWSEALKNYPGLFPEMTFAVIAAGEAGGFLERACLILADDAEREYHIHQAIKREAWYPKILLFISTFLLPLPLPLGFGVVDFTLGGTAQMLMVGGAWGIWKIAKFLWPIGIRAEQMQLRIDTMKLKIPLLGPVVRALAAAKFCRFLGMSYASGLSLPRGVALAAAACGNAVTARNLASIIPDLEHGRALSEALIVTGELPKTVLPLLHSGELSGDLEPQLQTAARFLEGDAETALHQSVIAFGAIILLLAAAKIGAQVIAFHASSAGL